MTTDAHLALLVGGVREHGGAGGGWKRMLSGLEARLETGEPRDR
ncbi:MAG TPA: hypothetical protein VK306_02885 [Acidimicrobiales bacterium]|nr:hypothetical protein [Acidimicrobiales bacterium]